MTSHEDRESLFAIGADVLLNIIVELKSQVFLIIPPGRVPFFEQHMSLFGDDVEVRFPDATRDIAAAGRCYALEEWTSCIFHLMRVLEHGLRPIAERFDVSFKIDSWHTVLRGIEAGLAGLRNKSNLTERERLEITYYSEAASQFRHFKDAWRNHVSHAREHYEQRQADAVMSHVKEFMQHLAKGLHSDA